MKQSIRGDPQLVDRTRSPSVPARKVTVCPEGQGDRGHRLPSQHASGVRQVADPQAKAVVCAFHVNCGKPEVKFQNQAQCVAGISLWVPPLTGRLRHSWVYGQLDPGSPPRAGTRSWSALHSQAPTAAVSRPRGVAPGELAGASGATRRSFRATLC